MNLLTTSRSPMTRSLPLAVTILLSSAVLAGKSLYAVDGDTVRDGARSYRLIGFDTPETFFARCVAERRLGEVAKARLERLLEEPHELRPTGQDDRYGRALARLYINGRDVADIMVEEKLADRYDPSGRFGRKKRRNWCEPN